MRLSLKFMLLIPQGDPDIPSQRQAFVGGLAKMPHKGPFENAL